MARSLPIEPFTAAYLEQLTDEERSAELTRRGIRFLKANDLMAWDGRDHDRALDLAATSYKKTLWRISTAREQVRS